MESCHEQWGLRSHHDERRERPGHLHPGSSGFERGTCGHRHIQLKFLSTYCAVPPQYLRELPTNLDAVEREPSCADCIHPEYIGSWPDIHFRRPSSRRDVTQERHFQSELEHTRYDLAADGWPAERRLRRRPCCYRDGDGDQSHRHNHLCGWHWCSFCTDDGHDGQCTSSATLIRDMPNVCPRCSKPVCGLLQPGYEPELASSTLLAAAAAAADCSSATCFAATAVLNSTAVATAAVGASLPASALGPRPAQRVFAPATVATSIAAVAAEAAVFSAAGAPATLATAASSSTSTTYGTATDRLCMRKRLPVR